MLKKYIQETCSSLYLKIFFKEKKKKTFTSKINLIYLLTQNIIKNSDSRVNIIYKRKQSLQDGELFLPMTIFK